MRCVIILNDPPYGSERSYNGLRLANSLAKDGKAAVSVFLMGDATCCAVAGQQPPAGYYNIESMLRILSARKGRIGVCGSCMDARGIVPQSLAAGAHRSSMEELTCWTKEAQQVIVF